MKAETVYENFIETLTEEQKTMFEEVLDSLFELNDSISQKDFEQGFKAGLKIAFEAITAQ